MAITHVITTSAFEFGNRIDAELYQPGLRVSYQKICASGFEIKPLRRLCTIRSGTTPPDRDDGLKSGPILFKTTDVRNGIIPPNGSYYRISNYIHQKMSKTKLQQHDVLMNIVGATLEVIGRTAFITNLPEEANITQAMVFLRCNTPEISAGYLFAYLNTIFAQDQVKRFARPTGQYNLNLHEVGQIRIALPPKSNQLEIDDLIISAAHLQEISEKCYLKANLLLESELGLDKLNFQKPVGYTARFSELEQSRRLDPEHFYPAFQNLIANLPDHINLVPLGTQLSFCQRGKQPVYSKHGLPVVNSKHVQSNKVVLEGNRSAISNLIADLQIRHGDILMNGTGRGTIGRVAPYLVDEQAIPDNHVSILRSPTLDPAYLSFYLNSQAGQLQVEMNQRGSSGQLELYPFDIRKFLVWVAPDSLQKEIRRLYDQAAASEQRSRELLDQAKARVEQLIEEAVRS